MFGSTIKTYGKKKSGSTGNGGQSGGASITSHSSMTNRSALGQLTNLPTLFEADDEASPLGLESPLTKRTKGGGSRNGKRGNPGTPREEVRTATKTTRLFSPAVSLLLINRFGSLLWLILICCWMVGVDERVWPSYAQPIRYDGFISIHGVK